MSLVTLINNFFKLAGTEEIELIQKKVIFTDRQQQIFQMYYLKKQNVNYIADTLYVCPQVINKELKIIRDKLVKAKII